MGKELPAIRPDTTTPSPVDAHPTFTPGIGGGDAGNVRGREVEARVARVLSALPDVASVRQTEKDGPEDCAMTDLVVELGDQFQSQGIDSVKVQVKAGRATQRLFRERLRKRLRKQGLPHDQEAKDAYLVRNGLIVLNGGETKSRKNEKTVVGDEKIIADFSQQLTRIVEARTERMTGE